MNTLTPVKRGWNRDGTTYRLGSVVIKKCYPGYSEHPWNLQFQEIDEYYDNFVPALEAAEKIATTQGETL